MDFNDSIILTFGKNRKGKFVIGKKDILGMFTAVERNYTTSSDEEKTFIRITFEIADLIGLDPRHSYREQKHCDVQIEEELAVVLGLVRGSKSAEVLFGAK